MKKAVLLGDSIRQIGYGPRVAELLSEEYEVWQPKDNCRFAKYTLRMIWSWKEEMAGADVIHWNNGLWDESDLYGDGQLTPNDEYVQTMVRIARILKTIGKTVIFATSTPPKPANLYNKAERIAAMNALVVPALEKEGVLINDLFTTVNDHIDDYIRSDDNIHLTDAGIEACAKQVADAVRAAAEAQS